MTEQLKDMVLPGGTPAKVLTQAQIEVLVEIIERELWWHGARRRLRAMSGWAIMASGTLTALSLLWPWIDRIMRGLAAMSQVG